MKTIFHRGVAALTLAAAVAFGASGAWAQQGCMVNISSPGTGSGVALVDTVRGTASIPGEAHVWVFTHRKGINQWWPQGSGPVLSGMGGWATYATFGTAAEAGQPFQVVAMPVDDAENERLMNWIIQTKVSGEFPPIALPAPMAGCTGRILTVRRM